MTGGKIYGGPLASYVTHGGGNLYSQIIVPDTTPLAPTSYTVNSTSQTWVATPSTMNYKWGRWTGRCMQNGDTQPTVSRRMVRSLNVPFDNSWQVSDVIPFLGNSQRLATAPDGTMLMTTGTYSNGAESRRGFLWKPGSTTLTEIILPVPTDLAVFEAYTTKLYWSGSSFVGRIANSTEQYYTVSVIGEVSGVVTGIPPGFEPVDDAWPQYANNSGLQWTTGRTRILVNHPTVRNLFWDVYVSLNSSTGIYEHQPTFAVQFHDGTVSPFKRMVQKWEAGRMYNAFFYQGYWYCLGAYTESVNRWYRTNKNIWKDEVATTDWIQCSPGSGITNQHIPFGD